MSSSDTSVYYYYYLKEGLLLIIQFEFEQFCLLSSKALVLFYLLRICTILILLFPKLLLDFVLDVFISKLL